MGDTQRKQIPRSWNGRRCHRTGSVLAGGRGRSSLGGLGALIVSIAMVVLHLGG